MNPDLEQLIHLQRVENELRRAESALADVPRHKEALEAALGEERRRLDAAKEALAGCQKSRRQHEADLQDLETKRSKYKGQLMDVKTNKEYTAMLHEIEGVEREIRSREDQILVEMEQTEELQAGLKGEEAAFKAAQERHRSEAALLDGQAETLSEEARRLTVQRDGVVSLISADALELYHRVASLRGVAVAEAREGMCQVCHLKLRLQLYADLKRNEVIVQCPACNRILYFEAVPTAVAPEP